MKLSQQRIQAVKRRKMELAALIWQWPPCPKHCYPSNPFKSVASGHFRRPFSAFRFPVAFSRAFAFFFFFFCSARSWRRRIFQPGAAGATWLPRPVGHPGPGRHRHPRLLAFCSSIAMCSFPLSFFLCSFLLLSPGMCGDACMHAVPFFFSPSGCVLFYFLHFPLPFHCLSLYLFSFFLPFFLSFCLTLFFFVSRMAKARGQQGGWVPGVSAATRAGAMPAATGSAG